MKYVSVHICRMDDKNVNPERVKKVVEWEVELRLNRAQHPFLMQQAKLAMEMTVTNQVAQPPNTTAAADNPLAAAST